MNVRMTAARGIVKITRPPARSDHGSPRVASFTFSIACRPAARNDAAVVETARTSGGSRHLIKITDNGIGFDPEDAENIFKVFHRLHGRSEYEGTGVGLAIVQKVVQNHGGHIWAIGEPGKGATFRLLLPATV